MKYTTYFSICLALRRKKVYTLITVHSGKVVWKKDQIDNMEEEMKKMVKRTAVVTLAGVMSCPRTTTADNNHVFKLYGKCR